MSKSFVPSDTVTSPFTVKALNVPTLVKDEFTTALPSAVPDNTFTPFIAYDDDVGMLKLFFFTSALFVNVPPAWTINTIFESSLPFVTVSITVLTRPCSSTSPASSISNDIPAPRPAAGVPLVS